MATLYIKQDGTASGGYTTIAAAVTAASAGDTLEILDNESYNESVSVLVDNLKIRSAAFVSGTLDTLPIMNGISPTTIGGNPFENFNSGTQLLGLEVKYYTGSIVDPRSVAGRCYVLSGCHIHDLSGNGVSDISGTSQSDHAIVDRCKIHHVNRAITSAYPYITVTNVLAWALGDGDNGILLSDNSTTAAFCTVDFRINCGNGFINQWGIQAGTTWNCVVSGTRTGGGTNNFSGIRSTSASYNCVHISGTNTPYVDFSNVSRSLGTGEIIANPSFVDSSSGDFKLSSGSACRNAGFAFTGVLGPVDIDLTGTIRPKNSGYDIGALESVARVQSAKLIDPATVRLTLDESVGYDASLVNRQNYAFSAQNAYPGNRPHVHYVTLDSDYSASYIDVHANRHVAGNTFKITVQKLSGVLNGTKQYAHSGDRRMSVFDRKRNLFVKKYRRGN